jgi:threonine dehydrogenase-like Zn-dependent dehydrogenase
VVEAVADLTDGIGPDVVIEAVGSIPTYEDSVAAVRRGGKVLAYGAAPMDRSMSLRPFDAYAKELTIVGSYAGTYDTWPRAIELLSGAGSARASSSTRCGRSTKRWTRSAASSATRARSRSTFRHEGTASRLGR